MIQIHLPWPAKPLHPNFRSRTHWAKTRATKKARGDAARATLAYAGPRALRSIPDGPLSVLTAFYPPIARSRDGDNLLAACKPLFDGIADELGVDDSRFRHQEPITGEPVRGGEVVVTITCSTSASSNTSGPTSTRCPSAEAEEGFSTVSSPYSQGCSLASTNSRGA